MKNKRLNISVMIIAIGLVLSLVACLISNIIMEPTVTEQEFNYTITYKLNGETKTLEGVYTCRYSGYSKGQNPRDRYYTGEYTVDGQVTPGHTYTIAEKDGAELFIVMLLNNYYLMGDTKDMDYQSFLDDPYLEAVDKEGYAYDEPTNASEFDAEIVSWEYPEPIENKFTFGGFALMHTGSMVAMLVVGLLTILACIIFIKRDKTVPYKVLDKVSIAFNCIICFVVLPFITVITTLLQIATSTSGLQYQIYQCIPALTALTVAASIALRRNGFTKTGFFLQFIGPVLFFVPIILGNF